MSAAAPGGADLHAPQWRRRRWLVFLLCAFCCAVIGWLTVRGADTRLAETLANGAYLLLGALANGYIFGAVLDDGNVMKQRAKLAEIKNGNGKE